MKATKEYTKQRFDEFNRLMFGGILPDIPIEMSRARTFLGQCVFKKRKKLFGRTELYDFRLKISSQFDLPVNELDDVIIHEMIHYYIGVNHLNDTSAHGQIFRRMMNEINIRYGRHVAISHRLSQEQRRQMNSERRRHGVAVVEFDDGRTGLKVIPAIAERMLFYYNNVRKAKGVVSVRLYISYDSYFNQYPSSSSLRYHIIDHSLLSLHLHEEEKIACDGKTLVFKPEKGQQK